MPGPDLEEQRLCPLWGAPCPRGVLTRVKEMSERPLMTSPSSAATPAGGAEPSSGPEGTPCLWGALSCCPALDLVKEQPVVTMWALGISRGGFTPDSGVQCSIFPLGFQKIRPDNELFEVRDKPGPEMPNMAPSVPNSADLTDAREINFEYLKHVVLKFMSCRESEVEASESPVG